MRVTRLLSIYVYIWCAAIILDISLCRAEDQPTASTQVNWEATGMDGLTPLMNSTSNSTEQVDSHKRTIDTNTKRFFLFRLFQRRKRNVHENQGRRRKALALKMNEKLDEARKVLIDRMAAVSFNLIDYEHDASMNNSSTFFLSDGNDDDITPQSDLSLPSRSIYVVTTAALTWRTGTAVNPLLRAAYLSRRIKLINTQQPIINAVAMLGEKQLNKTTCEPNSTEAEPTKQYVTLVIPWLELEEDRLELYGPNHTFSNPQEQEAYIRDWLMNDANMPDQANQDSGLKILFYPARYHSWLKSIFAMGDICAVLRNQTTNGDLSNAVCILEEPEHCKHILAICYLIQSCLLMSHKFIYCIVVNWYRAPGDGWTKVFNYVVGIVHTNYIEYASTQFHGLWTAPAIQVMSSAMVRAYCHKVIKLSGVLQTYAPEKEVIENVHGVREDFLREYGFEEKRIETITHLAVAWLPQRMYMLSNRLLNLAYHDLPNDTARTMFRVGIHAYKKRKGLL